MLKINKNEKFVSLPLVSFKRNIKITKEDVDLEGRLFKASLSSEDPYLREFGWEILSHDPKHMRLERFKAGAPILLEHNKDEQVGVINAFEITQDRKLVITEGLMSKSQKGQDTLQDIADGIKTNLSVGYVVHEMKYMGDDLNGTPKFLITDWEPTEGSIVGQPADITVGLCRSLDGKELDFKKELELKLQAQELINLEDADKSIADKKEVIDNINVVDIKKDNYNIINVEIKTQENKKMETNDTQKILEVAKKANELALGADMIASNKTYIEFLEALNEKRSKAKDQADYAKTLGLTVSDKEIRNYSIFNAVSNTKNKSGEEWALSKAMAEKNGGYHSGHENAFIVPGAVWSKMNGKKDYVTNGGPLGSDPSKGGYLVEESLHDEDYIEVLRNKLALKNVKMVQTGPGNYNVTRQTSGSSSFFVPENGDATESSATFELVNGKPRNMSSFTVLSNISLRQSTPSAERVAMNDMLQSRARLLEQVAIYGDGVIQPRGLKNTAGVGVIQLGANGAGVQHKDMVALESLLTGSNCDMNTVSYLTNAKGLGALKTTQKGVNLDFIYENSKANGYDVNVTNMILGNKTKGTGTGLSEIWIGDWSEAYMLFWGQPELIFDIYTLSQKGQTQISMWQPSDIIFRHPNCFAYINDVDTNNIYIPSA